MNIYKPGSHILATLSCKNSTLLLKSINFKKLIEGLISEFNLNCLGTVFHDFSPSGFTAIVCLSESHISLHTWPEYNKVNLDIYLSNFERENDATVDGLYRAILDFFEADELHYLKVKR